MYMHRYTFLHKYIIITHFNVYQLFPKCCVMKPRFSSTFLNIIVLITNIFSFFCHDDSTSQNILLVILNDTSIQPKKI